MRTGHKVLCSNLGNALPSGIYIPFFQTLQSQTSFVKKKNKFKGSEMILSEKQCFLQQISETSFQTPSSKGIKIGNGFTALFVTSMFQSKPIEAPGQYCTALGAMSIPENKIRFTKGKGSHKSQSRHTRFSNCLDK